MKNKELNKLQNEYEQKQMELEQLEVKLNKLVAESNKNPYVFVDGDEVYYLSMGGVIVRMSPYNSDNGGDVLKALNGSIYKTKEDAEFHKMQHIIINSLRQTAWDSRHEGVFVNSSCYKMHYSQFGEIVAVPVKVQSDVDIDTLHDDYLYYATHADCVNAIKNTPRSALLKYIFGINNTEVQ